MTFITSLWRVQKLLYEMIISVRFCLSYDLFKYDLSPSEFVYFNENLHCCNGRRHDVTCFRRKCYVTGVHNIFYVSDDI